MAANLDEDPCAIVASRVFDAQRELVFEAFSHPNHLANWWGPLGFTTTTRAFEFRPGGVWRLVMHGPDGRDYQNLVTYDVIQPPQRIEYHHGGADDVEPAQFRTVVTFEDVGGKTKFTMRLLFPTAAERDRVIAEYGAAEGLVQTQARLGAYVAGWDKHGGLERTVTLTRHLDAPRALVFAAFTQAEHLARWWGPRGFTAPRCSIEARPGGAIDILMQGPGDFSHPMTGTVHEVVPPERLVFTAVARDHDGTILLESRTTITLHEEDGGTRLTVEARAKGKVAVARMMLAGMEQGWSESLDKLAETVVQGHGMVMTTVSTHEEAKTIAKALVDARLAACVQIMQVDSVYRWKGEVTEAGEFLLFVKTRKALFESAIAAIKAAHSYDLPEIVAVPFSAGSRPYLGWIDAETL